jgi:murein DD-endopeptidase MepM/ murein hydrolase activator NlpD
VDIMRVGEGGIHRPGRTDLASYYIYDQPVLAPADGTVTYVLVGRPDQPIGSVDERYPSGNQLVIDIGGGRYLMMGHLREGSIKVNVGEPKANESRGSETPATPAPPTSTFRRRRCRPLSGT